MAKPKIGNEDTTPYVYPRTPDTMWVDKHGNGVSFQTVVAQDSAHETYTQGMLHCKTPYGHASYPLVTLNDGAVYWDDPKLQRLVTDIKSRLGAPTMSTVFGTERPYSQMPIEGLLAIPPKNITVQELDVSDGTLHGTHFAGRADALARACRAEFQSISISYDPKVSARPPKATPARATTTGWDNITITRNR